eukprot:CAMPEP_0195161686 /NCGR_PEP_ID=MMETSP0448-20130528/187292_1 /TAXON_ID=66468 /ORGANISM="Heterocapsa triquestra, Strain CCMP 448" /LENGTH=115 /DNA_ID=CAMNT_0040200487 /DNA_START=625 /DNA_END=969 /DNA_ORIENTATION=+
MQGVHLQRHDAAEVTFSGSELRGGRCRHGIGLLIARADGGGRHVAERSRAERRRVVALCRQNRRPPMCHDRLLGGYTIGLPPGLQLARGAAVAMAAIYAVRAALGPPEPRAWPAF